MYRAPEHNVTVLILALFGLSAVLFAILAFTIGVIASQCLNAIRDTDAESKLKAAILETKPSRIVPSFSWTDGHPMDTRVWFALRDAKYLPTTIQRKARLIGQLYDAEKVIFGAFVIAIISLFWA